MELESNFINAKQGKKKGIHNSPRAKVAFDLL